MEGLTPHFPLSLKTRKYIVEVYYHNCYLINNTLTFIILKQWNMESSVVKGLIRHTLKEQRLQPQTGLQSSNYLPLICLFPKVPRLITGHHLMQLWDLLSALCPNIFPPTHTQRIYYWREKGSKCTKICMFN